ncbi:MAG: erythromycin esterase family protein, partial [Deltaproteobacteria bacterium]|nr:erythromycin esterase family protein [Deltaproteobacteria bacterium]
TVADLAAFLCEFNRTHADDPVRFVGFDNRQPWIDEPALREWLGRVVPAEGTELADGLSTCFGVGYADEMAFFSDPNVMAIFMGMATTGEEDHVACVAGASALSGFMRSRRDELVDASGEDEWERMRLALVRIESFDTQAYHFFGRGQGALGQSARDAAMADVLLTLRRLDHPGSRTVLWAHNYHVSRNSDSIEGVTAYRGAVNIGTLLAREPSVRYVAIGLSAYDVRYDWLAGPDQYLHDSTEAVERMLHDLEQPYLFVHFAEASVGGGSLIEPDGLHLVSSEGMIPREHYDGLLFLDVSHPPTWVGGTSPFGMLPGM